MLTNATITAWRRRTGSDSAGQATWQTEAIATPVRCLRTAVTADQQELLATHDEQATETVLHRVDRTGAPDIDAGDRVQLDGGSAWHQVVRRAVVTQGGVSHRRLYVREID